MIRLPITTASDINATCLAVSASLTPNPTAIGRSLYFLILLTRSET